ncbi:hypothetical protein EXM22_07420 [Oceanispirochaeta crateris]|uniref:LA2681-like HEPN domain-containing protein n=1 Tax=Oceanispirochaeta crateris TaxID=2518645 RepID=A0A5C1QK22_9SPIO|nr:tetratricopeptide repeat protein [Oceanispirochaeta crateris]QEN07827.1 hypothetical protein EXM22_07420 [Oceanispirochaeta crateris]
MYNPFVESFAVQIKTARSLMEEGQYQQAFDLIVDKEVQVLPDLLGKIECMIDIGFILRDEKILRYGLYLLEKHGSEVLEVPDLGPLYFLNLGHQYSNMVTLSSFENEYYGFFCRTEQTKARQYYEKVLRYGSISSRVEFEAHKGLGQMYQSSGRGLEALASYQKALKINPLSREILHEKIRLMKEYALPSQPNRTEFLQEAWALLEKSSLSREDDDDQEDVIIKNRLLDSGLKREILETPGEYPLHSFPSRSKEEYFYTNFCLKNQLYLNLCTFCRKCDFSKGDTLGLSSSNLTIRKGQKNRFVRLNKYFNLLQDKYATGRYLLLDTLNPEHDKQYLDRSAGESDLKSISVKSRNFFQLSSAYLTGWSLWDDAAEFISVFWGMENPGSLRSLFYTGTSVKSVWHQNRSPSLHAVFELYSECILGSKQRMEKMALALENGPAQWTEVDYEELKDLCLDLYFQLNLMIQYLGIMHERNESATDYWDFPRPLYNFVSLNEDNKSK